jgi:hypothetical protein
MKMQHVQYVISVSLIFTLCPPVWGEILRSVDAEDASIRNRKDRKDNFNFSKKSIDGDLRDNGLLLEGQVQGYARPLVINSNEYRQGSHSLMFQVQPNTRSKERSEIWFEGSRDQPKPFDPTFIKGSRSSVIPWREERYTAFSFKLPADYKVGASNYITQFWQRADKAPAASLQLYRKDGQLKGTLEVTNDQGAQIVDQFPVERDMWYDVILNYRFSPKPGEGFMKAWVRPVNRKQYRQLKLYRGAIGFSERSDRQSEGLFHKFGIYRPGKDSVQHTIFLDEIRNARPSPNVFYEIDPSFINPQQFYVLKNTAANAALSVQGGTVTSGSRAVLSAESRRGWQFVYAGKGYYQLLSSGKALEAKQGDNQSWNSGDSVQFADPQALTSQQWYLVDRGKGNYQIINRASRLVLAGRSETTEEGAVQLESPMTKAPQLWRFGS